MQFNAQQRWFESCIKNFNRRKEEELTRAWSRLALIIGSVVLLIIFTMQVIIY